MVIVSKDDLPRRYVATIDVELQGRSRVQIPVMARTAGVMR
jgi:hypothetical protein